MDAEVYKEPLRATSEIFLCVVPDAQEILPLGRGETAPPTVKIIRTGSSHCKLFSPTLLGQCHNTSHDEPGEVGGGLR